jgi:hypothetical protein
MQWLQDPNRSNVDNLNNVKREVNRHFRKKEDIFGRQKLMKLNLTVI